MWRDEALLLDMLIAARRAKEFSAGLDRQAFESSLLHQQGIMRCLETVGEAARRVSEDTRRRYPQVPWSEIIGMRHRLVHEYFRIDLDRVWDTVQKDLQPLIALLEPLVPPEKA
ncbi:MAG: HepT-like ribonuclease domain-containing protein [Candidatus Binatia bacterium]